MESNIFNQGWSRDRRRDLRQEMTKAEEIVWSCLRGKQFRGWKFRRQHGIGPYIADFFCHELHLVVEIDGPIHQSADRRQYDQERDAYLHGLRLRVFHCTNEEVVNSINILLDCLGRFIDEVPPLDAGEG